MSTPTRVVGVMLVHDEWPLAALSVSYALVHHVDSLVVVDHASSDSTLDGLAVLSELFGDRLTVLRTGDVAFRQEALVAWALEHVTLDPSDWIYAVDADEFLLAGQGRTLKEILGEIPAGVDTVRYALDNFVAPRQGISHSLHAISAVRERAIASVFIDLPGSLLFEQVDAGDVNFFDLAFRSKVISRQLSTWLMAGAHGVAGQRNDEVYEIDRDVLRAAHVPLISRARLDLRAKAGHRLVEAGYDADHGWQSQLMWHLQQQGRLDEFWERHSVGPHGPNSVTDEALTSSMAIVLEKLAPYEATIVAPPRRERSNDVDATSDDVFRSLAHLQRRVGGFLEAKAERFHEERDQLVALRGELAESERQRDELLRDREAVRNSYAWRIGTRVVGLLGILKRLRSR